MIFFKLASFFGAVFQISGGTTLAVITAAVVAAENGVSLDPALAAAYGAIGALFGLVTWLAKGRIERCEGREDKLLGADSDKTATMRELATVVSKATDVTSAAVAAANSTLEETKRNGVKLDRLEGIYNAVVPDVRDTKAKVDDLGKRFDDLSRKLDTVIPR